MPVLITAVAAFVVSVLRRPIDARLKRRYGGPLAVVAGFGLIVVLWARLCPDGIRVVYLAGELCGVTAMYLMAWTLLLATRARRLEPWFGGLDRMYLWHRRAAVVSTVLLAPHVLVTGRGRPPIDLDRITQTQRVGVVLGQLALGGLLALVAISLPRIGRILRVRYERWLVLHRLIGLFVLLAVVHGPAVDAVIGGSAVLTAVYLAIGCAGLGAYAYTELVMRRRAPVADVVVSGVRRLSPDVLELVLDPLAGPLTVRPGQFVFLRIGGDDAGREHPFTVAGTLPNGRLRLTIRARGRDTAHMHEHLHPGLPATVTGPFGMFDHTVGGPRQIWVAGGIGVAPFLSWLTALDDPALDRVDLYYASPTEADAVFQAELQAAAQDHPAVRLHLVRTRESGHLTVADVVADGPLDPHTHVFLCGPTPMVDGLTRDFRRHGLSRDHVHSEHFAFR